MIPIEYHEKYPNRDYSLQREELRECTESAIFEMNIEYDSPEFWSLYIRQISPENACKLIDLAKMNLYVKFEFLKLLRKSPKYKNAILELIDSILSENFYDYEIIFCVYDIDVAFFAVGNYINQVIPVQNIMYPMISGGKRS